MASSLRQSSTTAVNFFFLVDIFTCVLGILILVTLMLTTQASTNTETRSGATALDQERQQELTRLLDELSRLNASNDALQRSVAAAEAAPGQASLQSEIQDLTQAISAQHQQESKLQDALGRLEQTGTKRDDVLGLTHLSQQVEKLKEEVAALQPLLDNTLVDMTRVEAKVKEAEAELLAIKGLKDKLWVIPDLSQTSKEPLLVTVAEHAIRVERFNKPSETVLISHADAEDEFQAALKRYDPLNFYAVFYVKPSGISTFEKIREIAKNANFEIGYDALEENTEIVFSKQE